MGNLKNTIKKKKSSKHIFDVWQINARITKEDEEIDTLAKKKEDILKLIKGHFTHMYVAFIHGTRAACIVRLLS